MDGQPMLTRRRLITGSAMGAGGLATAMLLDPGLALGADKTLTVAIPNNPQTFDPMNQTNHDAMAATLVMFENLIENDVNGELRPQLAAAMPTISDDKLTYSFDLRDDVYFQNGAKFTAEDVKYSYDYVLDPKNKAIRRSIWLPIKSITVESPTRVRFDLHQPYSPWLYYMTKFMGIFPKGSREQHGDDYFRLTPIGVGTGPGIFVEWQQNDFVSFKRNPNYWQKGLPHWDRLIIKTVPEDSVRVAYLMTDQAKIISAPPPKDYLNVKKMPGISGASKVSLGCSLFMELNTAKPPFDDINFRRGVAFAIDRDLLAKDVFYGMIEPTTVLAPASSWWFDKEVASGIHYDPAKAKALIAESKYPNGAEFDMNVPAQPYLIDVRDAAIVIQSQLAAVGVKVNLKFLEVAAVLGRTIDGSHTASFFPNMGAGDPTLQIVSYYTPGQVQSKSSGYVDETLSALVAESYRTVDREALKKIYGKMQAILVRDCPGVWIGYVEIANLWRNEVRNFQVDSGLSIVVRDVDLA
ncbi:MAG TPA: ABC transporter substrate-binding protein [Stellaceae bacterium]|nr:ABC transporter substrate-binding protein [Stellaceae bacterium]